MEYLLFSVKGILNRAVCWNNKFSSVVQIPFPDVPGTDSCTEWLTSVDCGYHVISASQIFVKFFRTTFLKDRLTTNYFSDFLTTTCFLWSILSYMIIVIFKRTSSFCLFPVHLCSSLSPTKPIYSLLYFSYLTSSAHGFDLNK